MSGVAGGVGIEPAFHLPGSAGKFLQSIQRFFKKCYTWFNITGYMKISAFFRIPPFEISSSAYAHYRNNSSDFYDFSAKLQYS